MNKIDQFLRKYMLPLAIIIGVAGYKIITPLAIICPQLIFTMLLITYTQLSPKELQLKPLHFILLAIQIIGAMIVYALLRRQNETIAQGAFICLLMPTATAATIITRILGGKISFLTTYLLISNIAVSCLAPIFFSYIGQRNNLPFLQSTGIIASQVAPLLLLPLFITWFTRYNMPKIHDYLSKFLPHTFYIWAVALTIVMAKTTTFLLQQANNEPKIVLSLSIIAFLLCILQFSIGKLIGHIFINDSISVGQALAQKNTILGIWMTHTYLNPLASIAPAAYVLWQNAVNAIQIYLAERKNKMVIYNKNTK